MQFYYFRFCCASIWLINIHVDSWQTSSPSHLIYLFKSSKDSPIMVLIPALHPDPDPPIPLPTLFTLLSLYLHLNLALLLHPNEVRARIDIEIRSLSYQLSYVLAAVAPALCIFLGRSWQTVTWWSLTGTIVFVTHTVQESINRGNESISELEAMRYVAPGA